MSMSKTASIVKERLFDYLYDPLYHLAGQRDHERISRNAQTRLSKMEKLFNFENLFSEIPVYRPFEWRLKGNDPIPPSVSRQFRPVDVCQELFRLQLRKNLGITDDHVLFGADRPKYFTYNPSNSLFFTPSDQLQINQTVEPANGYESISPVDLFSKPVTYVSRSVQTIYRESEAQTDPYSPPYVVNVGENPEVLTLASMGYGHGLPAGLHDVEVIERARQRREIEASLEPYSKISHDPKKIAKRRKILEDLETKEWYFRECEVEALQEIRLKVLVQLLRKREEHQREITAQRLDRIWQERSEQKESKRKMIHCRYITELRKLMRKRLNTGNTKRNRDIIKEYATPSSEAFAPLTRNGVFPDRGSEKFVVKNHYLNTYEGLVELEASLPKHILEANLKFEHPQMYTCDGFLKREFRHQRELAELHEYLKGLEMTEKVSIKKPRFLQKIPKPIPRPITPSIAPPTEEDAVERELAAIILQQLIRGRAVQTQMYEAKCKRFELISEIRSTHALVEDERAEKYRQKLAIRNTQEQHAEVMHKDTMLDDVLGQFESRSLACMLDFLSKELDRLIEERRVHALVLLAERQRCIKEAEESGTRQREERRRREHDEIFKQLVKVHQESVDGYLAAVAGLTIDSTADKIARDEISKLAEQIDQQAINFEKNRDELKSDELAAELVYNFLIPEVNKRAYQNNKAKQERKYLQAAHDEIWGPVNDATELSPLKITTGTETEPEQMQKHVSDNISKHTPSSYDEQDDEQHLEGASDPEQSQETSTEKKSN